jgi:membrane peptidoglycan carboxypeptidase
MLATAVAVVLGAVFVHQAELRLATLPARVQTQLAAEGSYYVPLDQIPRTLQEATVSIEDRSFWTNIGISFEGIGRAALVDLQTHSFAQGGSTITQELIRDQLLSLRKTIGRKITGSLYAILLTQRMSKAEILGLYLNEVDYGGGAFGVAAAADTYFHLRAQQLDLAQSALLAGLPQDPQGLDPLVHYQDAKARQWIVLQAMVATGALSSAQAHAAYRAPLGLVP